MSFAGRVSLIKPVVTAIPLFYLSLFKAPISIYNRIISIQRRFLWEWGREKIAISWVSWETVCKSREEGGLRIKDIRLFNNALLAKWKWLLVSNEQGKWKDILEPKYGVDTNCSQVQMKFQSWWWKDLSNIRGEGEEVSWFQEALLWKVGSRDKVRFWEDNWLGGSHNLCLLYPRIFALSLDHGRTMREVGVWEDSTWNWQLRWRRVRFAWEVVQEEEMVSKISMYSFNRSFQDRQVWSGESSGEFTMRSTYEFQVARNSGESHDLFNMFW